MSIPVEPSEMNKLFWQILSVWTFLITACAPPNTVIPVATTQKATATRWPSTTSTKTAIPSATPTASITPLPTIPTFTPTFDVSTMVTITPAPKAECPKLDSAIKVENYFPEKLEWPSPNTVERILDFLNAGGDGQTLIARLKQIYPFGGDFRGGYDFYDVTGDQSPEFLYIEINYEGKLFIFSCKKGAYELLVTLPEESDFLEYTMQVINLTANGIPEIIVMGTKGVSYPVSTIYFYEWNGKTFADLGQNTILALRQTILSDVDGNGTQEISFSGDNPSCLSCKNFIPKRQRTITYGWNGKEFAEVANKFELPKYRFQSIQDADAMAIIGRYDQAIHFYEEAILNKELEWWSSGRLEYEQARSDSWIPDLTLPPEPAEDQAEYPRLAAYAYYRIMLLHLVQESEAEAETTYKTLQDKYGNDPYGEPYFEMATTFWEAYQSTRKMYDGCAAAIQYAVGHPEILIPLGSDYHGWQSHTYVPADVCPFR